MEIPKPAEEDKQRFRDIVPEGAGIEVKPMFGNLGAFVNGNMFMGLFGSDIGVKLPDDQLHELRAQPGSGPFGPSERPMSGYATLPAAWSTRKVAPWIDKALAHVSALPPKVAKKRATKKANRSAAGKDA
jgi:hypothetical protein